MSTVLLTGGSGFLGSHVAERLSREGRRVRALVRKSSDTAFLESLAGVELVDGSVGDAESLVRASEGVDAIVHSAGLVKARTPEEFHATNAGGTEKALEAARKQGVRRFVLVSSLAVAGPSHDGRPVTPTARPAPVTHYGRSKLSAERAVLAAKDDLSVVVLRPPAIYGPRDREILAFFKAVKSRVLPSVVSSESTLSMIYGPDCAAACVRAIDADVPTGSVFHLDDGRIHRFSDLVEAVEAAVGKRILLRMGIPRPVLRAAALGSELYGKVTNSAVMLTRDKLNELFAPHWVCDSSDAQRALGWAPETDIEDGMRRTADWYRTSGWL